jgi:hypothetical protein
MSHLYLYGSTGFGVGPSLLSSCVDLQCINLHGCTGITDDWLCSLAAACEQLWYVNVRGCTLLTDVSLTALRRLSCMRYLDLGGVTKLTTPALMLLSQCEALEILVLHPIRDSSLVVSKQTQLDAYLLREPQKTLRVVITTVGDMCKRYFIHPFSMGEGQIHMHGTQT